MSRILITGGAGFIGRNLAEHLQKKGHKTIVLDKIKSNFPNSIKADVTKDNWFKRVGKVDIIYHFAAVVGVDQVCTQPFKTMNTEIQGIYNVIKCAKISEAKKVVFSSTSAVYGSAAPNQVLSEDIKTFPITSYATAKLVAEHYLKEMKNVFGIDFSILRFFNVYGKYQDSKMVVARFINAAKENKQMCVFGDGKQTRDFTYIGDAVKAIEKVAFLKKTNSQIINIGTGTPTSIKNLACLIKELTGSKSKIIFKNPPKQRESYEIKRRVCDTSRQKKLIGFECKTTLKAGLKKII